LDCRRFKKTLKEGTPQVKRNSWSSGLSVTADGTGVVAHAGSVALRLLADRTGLTAELSKAMARRSFVPVHDRGRVLADVAVMIADGGEAIADIDVLRHQSQVLGPVASPPTVWRTLDEVTPGRLKKIATARARTRRHVWTQIVERHGALPASRVAGTDLGEVVVLDVDATIVITHSEKEQASPTFKRTFGYHPLGVWCDNTEEFLTGRLRTGKAGSNTAADHIEVLTEAIGQVPAAHRKNLLIRSDGAGASHQLLDWLHAQDQVRGRSVDYSVGFSVTENIREAIKLIPAKAWTSASDADGGIREGVTSPSSPGSSTRPCCRAGRSGCGSSCVANAPIRAPNSRCSRKPTGGATKPSPPTRPWDSSRSSKPATVPTPGSRTGSGTPKTPDWDGSPPASSRSTRPG